MCVCVSVTFKLLILVLHFLRLLCLSFIRCLPPSVIFARWYCAHLIFIYINAMFSLFCCFRPAVWISQALLIASTTSRAPSPPFDAACLSAHLPHSSPLCSVVVYDLTMCAAWWWAWRPAVNARTRHIAAHTHTHTDMSTHVCVCVWEHFLWHFNYTAAEDV